MKLTILGKQLDSSIEHEVFADDTLHPFGFNARIVFKDDSVYEGEVHTYHNLTEVHHMCDMFDNRSDSIAFESDIHYTGGTRRINEIVSVKVTIAKHLYKSY